VSPEVVIQIFESGKMSFNGKTGEEILDAFSTRFCVGVVVADGLALTFVVIAAKIRAVLEGFKK